MRYTAHPSMTNAPLAKQRDSLQTKGRETLSVAVKARRFSQTRGVWTTRRDIQWCLWLRQSKDGDAELQSSTVYHNLQYHHSHGRPVNRRHGPEVRRWSMSMSNKRARRLVLVLHALHEVFVCKRRNGAAEATNLKTWLEFRILILASRWRRHLVSLPCNHVCSFVQSQIERNLIDKEQL